MGKVIASITTSVDGFVTGPDDGPEYGLGRGGERLHYWVMGGPWTYQPAAETGFRFVADLDAALAQAAEAAGDGDVAVGGGADVIRQALAAGKVDELVISTAPVILGGGKRLFDGFDRDMDLEVAKAYSSPYATHVRYTVTK
jgi:riboflavin biosynthesis pyrimidine reductase